MRDCIACFDFLFIIRPTLLYPIWTFFLAGCWAGRYFNGFGILPSITINFLWTALALTLVMASIYIQNQVQDVETDKTNQKLFLIARDYVSSRAATLEATLLAAVGLILGFVLGWRFGVVLLFLFILGWLYNYPPTRWKNRTVWGLLSNGFLAVVCVSLGWMAAGGRTIVQPFMISYFFASAAVYLNTTLPDMEGDRKTGKITFAVRFGIEKTVLWAFILELSACIMAAYHQDWLMFGASLAVSPFFIISWIRKEVPPSVRATKASVVVLTAGVCYFFPLYFAPVFGVYFLSKWYYRKRFDLDYPSLKTT